MIGVNLFYYGILEVYRKIDYLVVNKEKGFMFYCFFYDGNFVWDNMKMS